ncbi:hypothetical protein AWZ03_014301 [Drosophila navojoa]|uniref:Uncharacterized protein n=1 Tax=Drosophila navojoa TaxID=7232 RepID=A0A484ARI0_DRONA|nr:hypothetical protein AWZ03_014301 [Drosophila navojoa]
MEQEKELELVLELEAGAYQEASFEARQQTSTLPLAAALASWLVCLLKDNSATAAAKWPKKVAEKQLARLCPTVPKDTNNWSKRWGESGGERFLWPDERGSLRLGRDTCNGRVK